MPKTSGFVNQTENGIVGDGFPVPPFFRGVSALYAGRATVANKFATAPTNSLPVPFYKNDRR